MDIQNDDQRLIGVRQVRAFLNNMPNTTFYDKLREGVIPKARYLGRMPVWRFCDIRDIYNQLSTVCLCAAKERKESR
jgi:predicted DNA-binding transcriptional regulator AlpA